MSSQLAKIRLVKCPRCHQFLPELSNVPVYQCGGCDAFLQVKKRKNGINEAGLHIHETEISQQNEVQQDDVDLSSEFVHPEREKLSPVSVRLSESQENSPQNQGSSLVHEAHDEDPEKAKTSEGVSPSNELTCHEIDDLSPETGMCKEFDISHHISGNFKKKMDPEGSSASPQKLSRKSTFFEQLELSQPREDTDVEPIKSEENKRLLVNNEKNMKKVVSTNICDSSFREIDDQDPNQYLRLLKGKYTSKYPNSLSREKRPRASKGYIRSRMRVQGDDQLSRPHFHSRNFSTVAYEYGSCSNSVPNHRKNSKLPPKSKDLEDEKPNLKKLILELQDQLNRLHTTNIDYQRPQMGHSCLKFPTRGRHCSSPTSPHFYSKPSQCTTRLNCNNHNTHCSCSELCIKTREIVKNYGARNYAIKRHVLPVKGGAPLVTCDNCSNLLQFTGDFLLYRKRYHRLRCGSCSYVLKYSLRNGYKLDRYVYEYDNSGDQAPAPPPSEVGDLNHGPSII